MVVSVLLGEDDDANIAAVKRDDENTAMAMPKINISVVANKIFLIKDEYNIPNAWGGDVRRGRNYLVYVMGLK